MLKIGWMIGQKMHFRLAGALATLALGAMVAVSSAAATADGNAPQSAIEWLESLEPETRATALIGYEEGQLEELLRQVEGLKGDVGVLLKKRRLVSITTEAQALLELLHGGLVATLEQDVERFMYGGASDYHRTLVQAHQVPFAGMAIPDEFTDTLKICIVDSGIDATHPDLVGLTQVTGESVPDKGFISRQSVGDWYVDEVGHGTHVAGIIAALDNNFGATGVLPNNRIALHIVKVFAPGFETNSSEIIYAVERCVAEGADIINMSLGSIARSRAEERAMRDAADAGVLLVAAAGNNGDAETLADQTRLHYPASYDSVVSVAAVDEQLNLGAFSQRNAQVELAAPGVDVYSTLPPHSAPPPATLVSGRLYIENLRFMQGGNYVPIPDTTSNVGLIIDCGYGTTTCQPPSSAQPHIVNGPFGCLIERGPANAPVTFAQKAQACETAGGTLAVIYNNQPGLFAGSLGTAAVNIPVLEVSAAMGGLIAGQQFPLLGRGGVENPRAGINILRTEKLSEYGELSGTSMASPVVAGVAALVWSHSPRCSAGFIRRSLRTQARDLGAPGRDSSFGFGLVQHLDTLNYLAANPYQICTL